MGLEARVVGRYAIFGPIASGGMATVHFGRLLGPVGFSRTVAVKRMRGELADDPDFVDMFVKEAKLAARVRHPNVVSTSDVIATGDEVLLVMEYVPGESLGRLAKEGAVPPPIAAAILLDVLHGLHAVHEAKAESGEPLDMVHRDVSPSNVLVGADGVARLIDFGVAKALGTKADATAPGTLKGKLAYMPPERLRGEEPTRATDVWAAGVVLWEALAGRRLHTGADDAAVVAHVFDAAFEAPSVHAEAAKPWDDVVKKALAADPKQRFATALEMAKALEACGAPAPRSDVIAFVESRAKAALEERAKMLFEVEQAVVLQPGQPSSESVRSVAGIRAKVVFGLVVPEHAIAQLAPKVDELAEWLGDEVGVDVIRRNAKSYESLARAVREGKVDLAWLPPIVYVRIIEGVNPLGSILRGGSAHYDAALVVKTSSNIEDVDDLHGARAGWVDPWSAAGFVMPRLELASRGVDPRALFRTERFVGSHRAAIEAVMDGAVDVAGTFARPEKSDSTETSGGWSEVENADVRILGRFGQIPPDVLAVRRNLLPSTHEKILAALRAATKSEEARPLVKAVFGGEDLTESLDEGYEKLRSRLDSAIARGLFD